MIKTYVNQIELEFGTGDIGFNSGNCIENGRKIGIVGFYNQDPREVGEDGDIEVGQECSTEDFPILMTFHKKKA
ncbi:hypothetical protein [Clostridium algidicarnis]|uniref:hypothetical protein n=1 Tax=Clostridium algidicarnis TaxID=37659 RepID=UPI001C0AAC84|nr:hypothetical protein [Clostridium algidicarnis]MBU3226785.1 hypothetical protein [Clostridium algidicarnis]MBU3250304.1 hypothetical protein [Clostridium algidicarnis]